MCSCKLPQNINSTNAKLFISLTVFPHFKHAWMEVGPASGDRGRLSDIFVGNFLSIRIALPSPAPSHLAFEKSKAKN